jgi:hypothetical protein
VALSAPVVFSIFALTLSRSRGNVQLGEYINGGGQLFPLRLAIMFPREKAQAQ